MPDHGQAKLATAIQGENCGSLFENPHRVRKALGKAISLFQVQWVYNHRLLSGFVVGLAFSMLMYFVYIPLLNVSNRSQIFTFECSLFSSLRALKGRCNPENRDWMATLIAFAHHDVIFLLVILNFCEGYQSKFV